MRVLANILLISSILIRIDGRIEPKDDSLITDENEAEKYLSGVDQELAKRLNTLSKAQWSYNTNITNQTSEAQIAATEVFNQLQKTQANETKKYDWSNFKKENNKRQFEKLAVIGTAALEGTDGEMFIKVSNQMETIYSSAKVCVDKQCDLELDPDLDKIMSNSKNYTTLTEAWVNWRDVSGKKMRADYITYYKLGNKAAKLNKLPNKEFETLDDLWLFSWETPDIKEQTAKLWDQLMPFYKKIHAYIRIKLKKMYPDQMPNDNTIPAHLLGNMWAQQWGHVMTKVDGVDPHPDVVPIDVTDKLVELKYNSTRMFELSEQFFFDLGFEKMTKLFWDKSVIDKPIDGTVMVCHASAWDFFVKDDFRIKQCTDIDMEDLITIHHEMGHIQYYMKYQNQPVVFREGANPGFHEAIGDLMALSVSTPGHLIVLELLDPIAEADLEKINLKFQLKMALDKVAFLPFGYIMDKWRWDVFSGEVSEKDLNRHWWKLRGQYQGLTPPVKRTEDDFDPGAKYHIPASVEYIRYFVSHILQFQFHKALCNFSQAGKDLHLCDINKDREAGDLLKKMLALGSSEKWPKQLELLTGSTQMDVGPLLEYFKPLVTFLDKELEGEKLGWDFDVNDYFIPDLRSSSFKTFNAINILSLITTLFILISILN